MKCLGMSWYRHCDVNVSSNSQTALFASFEPGCKSGKTESVTAVTFADKVLPVNKFGMEYSVLAIGTESGHIEVWAVPLSSSDERSTAPYLLYAVPRNDSHFYTVTKLAWRPSTLGDTGDAIKTTLTLASCSEDCGVRIFSFVIN